MMIYFIGLWERWFVGEAFGASWVGCKSTEDDKDDNRVRKMDSGINWLPWITKRCQLLSWKTYSVPFMLGLRFWNWRIVLRDKN